MYIKHILNMKRLTSIFLSGLVLTISTQAMASFSDVPLTQSNYAAINYFKSIGVLKGYPDGTFGIQKPINRAEALKVILVAAETPLSTEEIPTFADVPADAWFASYVNHAVANNIVSGDGATGLFVPERQVNRAEYLKMILKSFDIDPNSYILDVSVNDVSDDAWFAPYIKFAVKFGILPVDANGNTSPATPVTRSEAAQLLFNTLEKGKGLKAQTLLSTIEQHLISAVDGIESDKTLDSALHIGKAEYLDTILVTLLPNNETVNKAHTTVLAMKNLIGAYSAGQYGDPESVITASKKAWSAADEIPNENGQQSAMETEIKKLAESMAAKARAAKEK